MYIDYSSWETFEYKLNSLQLDKNNPRLRHLGSNLNQTQIIKYLVREEKVYELAKKISEEGYFVGEEPIICIEDNKKVVLEGNRRTASLKVIQNPKKYLSTAKANIILKNILENNFPFDRKIRCYIAPNRLLANPIIYERHNGHTLKRWETGNQYAFVAEMYYEDGLSIEDISDVLNIKRADIIKPLKAYNLFYEGKEILEKEEGIVVDISKFNFTNLERFYAYENARKLMGIDFDSENGQLLISLPREEFEKRLLVVFKILIDAERFSRDFNREEDKQKFIADLENNPDFDFTSTSESTGTSKKAEERANLEEEKKKVTPRRRKRSKKKKYETSIIPRDKEVIFDHEKLDELFSELKSLFFYNKNSFAVLLRSYLEQSLYYYLKQNSLLESLSEKTNEQNHKNGLKKVTTVIEHIKGKYGIADEIDPTPIMSILRFNSEKDYSNASLKIMLDYVKNNELDDHLDTNQLKSLKHYIDRIKDGLDLAVHNIETFVDAEHNKRAWVHLEPLFDILSTNIKIEE
tara:strand:- start:369365 stop:370927 length:1563 start_codon:yes stop_codon:yes gene_type:complete